MIAIISSLDIIIRRILIKNNKQLNKRNNNERKFSILHITIVLYIASGFLGAIIEIVLKLLNNNYFELIANLLLLVLSSYLIFEIYKAKLFIFQRK